MEIRELETEQEIFAAYALMRELRDRIREDTFLAEVRRQQVEGYRLYGGFHESRLVTLAGIRRTHTLSRGEHLFVDDLVTADGARGEACSSSRHSIPSDARTARSFITNTIGGMT